MKGGKANLNTKGGEKTALEVFLPRLQEEAFDEQG